MTDLTNADGFELESATHKDRGDVTDAVSIDRWSKYGNDRLYLNGLQTGDGHLDLQTGESDGDRWTKVSAEYELEGDTLTIEVGRTFRTSTYTLVVRVIGEDFEAVQEESEDEEESEAVCDGGTDLTAHVDDATIEDAIRQHHDPDHPDATTVEDVRDLLAHVQFSVEQGWAVYMDHLENGSITLVAESDDVLVFSTGEARMFEHELQETYDGPIELDEVTLRVVSTVIHRVAERRTDYNWGVAYPLVIAKPADYDAGQDVQTRHLMWLMDECGLSGGVALDYLMVEWRGLSQSLWATRSGKSQQTVSQNVRKARGEVVR